MAACERTPGILVGWRWLTEVGWSRLRNTPVWVPLVGIWLMFTSVGEVVAAFLFPPFAAVALGSGWTGMALCLGAICSRRLPSRIMGVVGAVLGGWIVWLLWPLSVLPLWYLAVRAGFSAS